jgi:glutathione peroxidase
MAFIVRMFSLILASAVWFFAPSTGRAVDGSAHDFSFTTLDGKPMPLADFKGKVLLVVNTASQCGFTPQYAGLQNLWQRYKDRGLVVIGVPSNDFGSQEPGDASAIQTFTQSQYHIDFPMTSKAIVSGDEAHPFYKWLRVQHGSMVRPMWNFHKFLIGKDGQLRDWFGSATAPDSEKLIAAIEEALAEQPQAPQQSPAPAGHSHGHSHGHPH